MHPCDDGSLGDKDQFFSLFPSEDQRCDGLAAPSLSWCLLQLQGGFCQERSLLVSFLPCWCRHQGQHAPLLQRSTGALGVTLRVSPVIQATRRESSHSVTWRKQTSSSFHHCQERQLHQSRNGQEIILPLGLLEGTALLEGTEHLYFGLWSVVDHLYHDMEAHYKNIFEDEGIEVFKEFGKG